MKFRFTPTFLSLGLLMLLSDSSAAYGRVIAPSPIYQRVANSDVVVVGKVVRFAKRSVKAKTYPTSTAVVEYRIAIVKIDDPILNRSGLTEVRVGVLPPPPPPPPGNPRIRRRPPGWGQFRPKVGERFLLFLQEHHESPMYVTRFYFDHTNLAKMTPALTQQIKEAKAFGKLLQKPMEGLRSKDALTRFQTAAMLLAHHRRYRPGKRKEVQIDPKESQLILQGLLDANWSPPYSYRQLHPQGAFNLLGLKPADGWNYPKDPKQYAPQARKWLQQNLKTYRIRKFVPDGAG